MHHSRDCNAACLLFMQNWNKLFHPILLVCVLYYMMGLACVNPHIYGDYLSHMLVACGIKVSSTQVKSSPQKIRSPFASLRVILTSRQSLFVLSIVAVGDVQRPFVCLFILFSHWCLPCVQAGEVWYEVAGELAQEGLRPVTPDQECLTEIMHTHEGKAEFVLKRQVQQ